MVDTLVLLLSPSTYHIDNPDAFTPSAQWALTNTIIPGILSKQHPTKRELHAGIYKPHLILTYRANIIGRLETILKIELSLPKLLFGNNFDELQYKDFASITHKLTTVLHSMGITTTPEALAHAPVVAIHYAKNMLFTDGSTPHYYINKIKESHIPLSLDINQTDYRNDGHSYKLHSNAYEVVFYDKIRDLEKAKQSDKRAVEKDNALQLDVLKHLRTGKKLEVLRTKVLRTKVLRREVLRMEVRLNKRQKMKQLFAKLGIKAELTFNKLFKPAIAKAILLHYLEELERRRPQLLDYQQSNDKAFLAELIVNNPDLTLKQSMQLFGLKQALEIMRPRELRMMFAKYTTRSWNRLMADASKVKLQRVQGIFGILKEHVVQFKALHLFNKGIK